MYHNLDAGHWTELKKIGEAGPINWQEGVACQVIGWKRFSNSTWEKQYQGYRKQVEQKIDELRISLNYPELINNFLKHTLITLLISVVIFVAAFFIPDDWEIIKTIAIWQLILWNIVYCIWALVLVKILRGKIRKGFREIEASIPELRLQFSMFCDCCCGCINQNYLTIYLKE